MDTTDAPEGATPAPRLDVAPWDPPDYLQARLHARAAEDPALRVVVLPTALLAGRLHYLAGDQGARRLGRDAGVRVEYLDGPDSPAVLHEFSAGVAVFVAAVAVLEGATGSGVFEAVRYLVARLRRDRDRGVLPAEGPVPFELRATVLDVGAVHAENVVIRGGDATEAAFAFALCKDDAAAQAVIADLLLSREDDGPPADEDRTG